VASVADSFSAAYHFKIFESREQNSVHHWHLAQAKLELFVTLTDLARHEKLFYEASTEGASKDKPDLCLSWERTPRRIRQEHCRCGLKRYRPTSATASEFVGNAIIDESQVTVIILQ
jgi:hypothetical protein